MLGLFLQLAADNELFAQAIFDASPRESTPTDLRCFCSVCHQRPPSKKGRVSRELIKVRRILVDKCAAFSDAAKSRRDKCSNALLHQSRETGSV